MTRPNPRKEIVERRVVQFLALLALLFSMAVPREALATLPTIPSAPTVANPYTPANTMMFAVTVTVSDYADDTDHDARVGYRVDDGATACTTGTGWKWSHTERFKTTATQTWTLYNFQPATPYQYFVKVGPPSGPWTTTCGTLGTTALPTNLDNLNITFGGAGGYSTQYIVIDTGDCGQGAGGPRDYLIALDVANQTIVWYLDVAAVSSSGGTLLAGWRYQPGTSIPHSNRFLATVDKSYLYQWRWDGTVVDSRDYSAGCAGAGGDAGPCISHDAFKSDATGRTYVAASQQSSTAVGGGTAWDGFADCGAGGHDSRFVNDGYQAFDGAFSTLSSDGYLMTDYSYDPNVDSGPSIATAGGCRAGYWSAQFDSANGPIDWTHINSIAAHKPGADELIDISFKEWDQVIRFNATTGALLWKLSPNAGYSTIGLGKDAGITGATGFKGQHFVHSQDGYLYMLDNEGDAGNGRVLRLTLSGVPINQATIAKSWAIVSPSTNNPVACPGLGSGMTVPGTSGASVLALCHQYYAIEELNDSDGVTSSQPPLLVTLPSAGFCAANGPGSRSGINGWYRAFPVTAIGEF